MYSARELGEHDDDRSSKIEDDSNERFEQSSKEREALPRNEHQESEDAHEISTKSNEKYLLEEEINVSEEEVSSESHEKSNQLKQPGLESSQKLNLFMGSNPPSDSYSFETADKAVLLEKNPTSPALQYCF